ncbi:hypothetical protein GGR56DRAFT_608790 [Xylariaceae sp. FL0804]|nr:hypothetical protein GGR56DRAFT_608790 [Xylariaceae sp. FL0804]
MYILDLRQIAERTTGQRSERPWGGQAGGRVPRLRSSFYTAAGSTMAQAQRRKDMQVEVAEKQRRQNGRERKKGSKEEKKKRRRTRREPEKRKKRGGRRREQEKRRRKKKSKSIPIHTRTHTHAVGETPPPFSANDCDCMEAAVGDPSTFFLLLIIFLSSSSSSVALSLSLSTPPVVAVRKHQPTQCLPRGVRRRLGARVG